MQQRQNQKDSKDWQVSQVSRQVPCLKFCLITLLLFLDDSDSDSDDSRNSTTNVTLSEVGLSFTPCLTEPDTTHPAYTVIQDGIYVFGGCCGRTCNEQRILVLVRKY